MKAIRAMIVLLFVGASASAITTPWAHACAFGPTVPQSLLRIAQMIQRVPANEKKLNHKRGKQHYGRLPFTPQDSAVVFIDHQPQMIFGRI